MDNLLYLIIVSLAVLFGSTALLLWQTQLRGKTASFWHIPVLILTSLFALTIVFAGLESYFRWFHDSTDAFGLTKTSENWFIRHYQPNSLGMRDDREYSLVPEKDQQRVTFFGDSFTAGHGIKDIEDRFANYVRNQKKDWEVHIFARNGFDTEQEIKLLNVILSKGYQLDHVVLIYGINDISEIVPEWKEILTKIYQDKDNESFFVKHSFFINFIYYRLKTLLSKNTKNYYQFVKKAYENPTLWTTQKSRLNVLRSTIQQHGGKLMVVTFPFLHKLGMEYEYLEIHKMLDRFWKKHKIPHLDLYSDFKDYAPKDVMVNAWDPHPNKLAHKIAGERILKFIEQQVD